MIFLFKEPFYAFAKSVLWSIQWSTLLYEVCSMVYLMGLLRTEIFFLSVIGDRTENSGWTMVQNAGVIRSGIAQSLLSGHDVVRTKHSHQVTACTLLTFMHKVYNHYLTVSLPDDFHSWKMKLQYLQFKY